MPPTSKAYARGLTKNLSDVSYPILSVQFLSYKRLCLTVFFFFFCVEQVSVNGLIYPPRTPAAVAVSI